MDKKCKKRLRKLIKLSRKMRQSEKAAEEETGMRHVPNEAFFKHKRKRLKALKRMDDEQLITAYAMREMMGKHAFMAPSKEAVSVFKGLRKTVEDTYHREGTIDALSSADYLDEDLETALHVLKHMSE